MILIHNILQNYNIEYTHKHDDGIILLKWY